MTAVVQACAVLMWTPKATTSWARAPFHGVGRASGGPTGAAEFDGHPQKAEEQGAPLGKA
ncbi:hypothetical protein SUDANB6_03397 [Streptomyces sp. enrichment culture]